MAGIYDNLREVSERIREAAMRAGRLPDAVRLVAASKTVPAERVAEAVRAGVRILGENYVQEAQRKIAVIRDPVSWHFIGHLQTNKVKYAVPMFDLIHSVDSFRLAREISRRAEKIGRTQDVLIQVNVSGEGSKSGVSPGQLEELLDQIRSLTHLCVRGLMTMPPFFDQPDRVRPFFARLRRLLETLQDRRTENIRLEELSMGMSGDFEAAIEEGATLVRVGTSIFGPRA